MTEAVKQFCKGKLVGKLKEVPEIRTSKGGKKYCMINLEVMGEKYPNFFVFMAWGEKAEELCKCKGGSIIEVVFNMKNNQYTTKNGEVKKEMFSPDNFTSKITVISQPEKEEVRDDVSIEEDDLPF
jgi:single-stranded DNA-binding protein